MSENTPIKKIPLPDLIAYRAELEGRHQLSLPLKKIPFFPDGNLKHLPVPLAEHRDAWPWSRESDLRFGMEEDLPRLTVVIPSFNQGVYLEEAIRSVVLQNYPNLELIVMDGGSTDDSLRVLKYYADFISCFLSEKDHGQSHAINKGFSIAGGELNYWLNSDDFMNLNSANHFIPLFRESPQLDIVYGDGLSVDATGEFTGFDKAPFVTDRYLRFGGIIMSHSIVWRKRVHCPVWEELQCAMDAELWLRLLSGKKYRPVHYPIGVFRRHPEQKTSNASVWGEKWQDDYEKFIWPHYSAITQFDWKLRCYEFRIVQKIYRFLKK